MDVATEWFVLRTHYLQEELASQALVARGYETFLPLARVEKRQRDGLLVAKHRPLFTSYLFVSFVPGNRRWQEIGSVNGIVGFVGYRAGMDKPPMVRHQDMEELKAHLAAQGGVIPLGISRPKVLMPHTVVQILFGPFRDRSALVQADLGSRVEVLMYFAGAKRISKLPRECLAVAG